MSTPEDIVMRPSQQYAQMSILTIPGSNADSPDPPNEGYEGPSLTHRSSKKGRSRKNRSSDGETSRSSTPLPETFASPQLPEASVPINVTNDAGVTSTSEDVNEVTTIPKPKPKEKKQSGDEEWATFAKELDKDDRTMMETAKDSIDSLLVFAGLFSAVVTAFCVLSLALLQPDPTDSTAVILAQISLQLSSLSIDGGQITSIQPPYTPSARFRATRSQITVNVLLFSSLILALIAASLGIIVKQWMREYAAPTSSQTVEHVCIRQYRFDGLRRWRVDVITRMLPLLLQVSLLLFFAGLSILLWTISTSVAVAGTVLVTIWLMFWLTSICLLTFCADCPYKSTESTIFFTLYQAVKSILILGVRVLAVYLRSHVTRPTRLNNLFWNLSFIHSKSYRSWRDREKEVVQKDTEPLIQRTIVCAHEISMDESMLEVATDAYVKSSDVDKRLNFLPKLFSMVAGRSEANLDNWWPDRSRRTHSLIRITLDTLTASNMPLHRSFVSSSRTRRELLLGVIGRYFSCNGRDSQPEEVIQELLDLPRRVDLLGASSGSLAAFTGGLWYVQSENHVVKIEAIESIAKCAVHAYDNTPDDYEEFVKTCYCLLRLLADGFSNEIISSQAEPLRQVRHIVDAVNKVVTVMKKHSRALRVYNQLSMCRALQEVPERYPALKPYLQDSVMSLLDLYTASDPDALPPQHSIRYWKVELRDALNGLWRLYNASPPPLFPLIPSDDTVKSSENVDNAFESFIPSNNTSLPAS